MIMQSLLDDLEGEKRYAGILKYCRMTTNDSLMKSAEACILIPVKTTDIWNSARCSALMTSTLLAY